MSESLREKIIKALLESSMNLRFTDLYNQVDNPSKSHFSHELHQLQNDKLVVRDAIDYKHVEYSLDRKKYQEFLQAQQQLLDEKIRKSLGL